MYIVQYFLKNDVLILEQKYSIRSSADELINELVEGAHADIKRVSPNDIIFKNDSVIRLTKI